MEADVLWKAAMKPRLHTGLGKRPPTTTRVSHISHSPCYKEKREGKGNQNQNRFIESVTYVPGLMCYPCSRSYTEGRMRGTPEYDFSACAAAFSGGFGQRVVDRAAHLLPPHPSFGHLLPPQKARGEKALDWRVLQDNGGSVGPYHFRSSSSMCRLTTKPAIAAL
jgi:hypothetical protein